MLDWVTVYKALVDVPVAQRPSVYPEAQPQLPRRQSFEVGFWYLNEV